MDAATTSIKKNGTFWGTPELDLFASRLNCQVNVYVSWKPDLSAVAIDAFSIPWSAILCYMFPPISLLGQVLRKVVEEKAEAISIALLWTTQYWFSILLSLLIDCIFSAPQEPAGSSWQSPTTTSKSLADSRPGIWEKLSSLNIQRSVQDIIMSSFR